MDLIFKSRITQLNPSVGNNTHEIVINRLIELWETDTEESRKLFNDIAERLAKYDNPKIPPIYYNKHTLRYFCVKSGLQLFSSKDPQHIREKRKDWLKYNR